MRAPVHAGEEFSFPLGLRSNAPATVAISRAIMSVAAPGSGKVPARLGLALFRTVRRQTAPWPVTRSLRRRLFLFARYNLRLLRSIAANI